MSDNQGECWACGEKIKLDEKNCPACDMPLTQSKVSMDDLDDFLSDTPKPPSQSVSPIVPDIPEDDSLDVPGLPDLPDDEMPDIPNFEGEKTVDSKADDLAFLDSVIEDKPKSNQEIMPDIPDFEDFDDFDEQIEEEIDESKVQLTSFSEMSIAKRMKFFGLQWLYWYVIFILIAFASYELINQNFDPLASIYNLDYYYQPLYLPYGWLAALALGFHFSFTIRKLGIEPKNKYLAIYLLGQFIFNYVVTTAILIYFNPNYFSGILNPKYYLVTSYLKFGITNFLITFLSLGVVTCYLGYSLLWKSIYDLTPKSKDITVGIQ